MSKIIRLRQNKGLRKSKSAKLNFIKSCWRVLLKVVWFGTVSFVACVFGTALFLGFLMILGIDSAGATEFISATLFSGICLLLLLFCFSRIFKGSSKTLMRWSRKSALILLPLVIIVGAITVVSIKQEDLKERSDAKNEDTAVTQNQCDGAQTLSRVVSQTLPIRSRTGSGTGFMLDKGEFIITAQHVVGNDPEPLINLVDRTVKTQLVKSNTDYDLALLKVDDEVGPLGLVSELRLHENYFLGEDIFAVGWPGNTFTAGSASVSKGIISRILTNSQLVLTDAKMPDNLELIQFDASVNPGNSGGPLVNKCGIVGVVIAISTSNIYNGLPRDEGISYAVSSKTVKRVLGIDQ